jgi:hypothetical protein
VVANQRGEEDEAGLGYTFLEQIQQCGWTCVNDKGRAHTGGMGISKKHKT